MKIIYGIALLFILLGCASKQSGEETSLKIVIAKYNNAVIEAYKNQILMPLKEVAVEDEVRRIDITVSTYLRGNQLMEADLHKIDFKDVRIEGDKATVRTSEDWSYKWVNYRTKKEVEPLRDIHYEMTYYLNKIGGKWLVEKVEELKEGERH